MRRARRASIAIQSNVSMNKPPRKGNLMPALTVLNGPIIRAGESLSDSVDCTGGTIVRLTMPASWNGGNITFAISSDDGGYNDLFTPDGKEFTMVVTPGAAIPIAFDGLTRCAAFLKIRSGTRQNPVVQTGQRDFAIALLPPEASP
jgi:hypothetical protein